MMTLEEARLCGGTPPGHADKSDRPCIPEALLSLHHRAFIDKWSGGNFLTPIRSIFPVAKNNYCFIDKDGLWGDR